MNIEDLSMYKPMNGYVIIKPLNDLHTIRDSGIIVRNKSAADPICEAIVMAVSKYGVRERKSGKRYDMPEEVQVGKKVLFSRFAGQEFRHNDVRYKFIEIEKVVSVLDSNNGEFDGTFCTEEEMGIVGRTYDTKL